MENLSHLTEKENEPGRHGSLPHCEMIFLRSILGLSGTLSLKILSELVFCFSGLEQLFIGLESSVRARSAASMRRL